MLLDMKYDIFSGFILGIFAKIYGIPVKCISNIANKIFKCCLYYFFKQYHYTEITNLSLILH